MEAKRSKAGAGDFLPGVPRLGHDHLTNPPTVNTRPPADVALAGYGGRVLAPRIEGEKMGPGLSLSAARAVLSPGPGLAAFRVGLTLCESLARRPAELREIR